MTKLEIKKALKRAYDQAWRDEPVWELRKIVGRAARKAVSDFINLGEYNEPRTY